MVTDSETLKLSPIFNRCLLDLEALSNFDLLEEDRHQAMQILSDAVAAALNVVGQRCGVCDSINIRCEDCK